MNPRSRSFRGLWFGVSLYIAFLVTPFLALLLRLEPATFVEHLTSEMAPRALSLTLRTTLAATFLCVAFGLPTAYLLARKEFRGRELLDTLTDLPITVPPVVAGGALLLAFGRMGLLGFTTATAVIAQMFVASPFFEDGEIRT